MKGLLVAHSSFGYGKVVKVGSNGFSVGFPDGNGKILSFARDSLKIGVLTRARLAIDDLALGPNGICTIHSLVDEASDRTSELLRPRSYVVRYEDGLTETASEIDLVLMGFARADTPLEALSSFNPGALETFAARERFFNALMRQGAQVGGLKALLSSRVELHPHQAFVAGTVMLDRRRRYILADEVGLGKTVEAGVVIHDLLLHRPQARVLILAPGPLVRQWLTELATSFGGQDFRLADLHEADAVDLSAWPRLIVSTTLAVGALREELKNARWDMVVVDEAHHLVDSPILYGVVTELAASARDLLLLSAIPARRRETEFLQLLALLEPDRYSALRRQECAENDGGPAGDVNTRFRELYDAQEMIGRRLSRLGAEVDALPTGEATPADVLAKAERLVDLPLLRGDARLQAALQDLRRAASDEYRLPDTVPAMSSASFPGLQSASPAIAAVLESVERLRSEILDRYRIHRRILRNRRQRLIADDRLSAISRRLSECPYEPDQVELEAIEAVEGLIGGAAARGLDPEIARPLARTALQALASPTSIGALLDDLTSPSDRASGREAVIERHELETLNAALGAGYLAWVNLVEILRTAAAPYFDPTQMAQAKRAVAVWTQVDSSRGRHRTLLHVIQDRLAAGATKILIFAGYPGLAISVSDLLKESFGNRAVADFRHDMDDAQKEECARQFRSNANVNMLVCDESGGEGRNFQFADEIIHFDLPWQVGLVEQRIGRLDRLGRTLPDVVSHVVAGAGSLEAGLLHCYGPEGLGVFTASISGAEFALRELQDQLIDTAVAACADGGGSDALKAVAPSLRDAVAGERARGDSDALLDEASFRSVAAERFLKAVDQGVEDEMEQAFVGYFRRISTPKSAVPFGDQKTSEGLWRFMPEEVRHGGLPFRNSEQANAVRRLGTFRRPLARTRRDLEFFAPGNPFFDALASSLGERGGGRTYAIACVAPRVASGAFVEFAMSLRPNIARLDRDPGLANLAETLFGVRRRSVVFPLGAISAVNEKPYLDLRAAARPETKGRTWTDLSSDLFASLVAQSVGNWPEYLRSAEARAQLYVKAAAQARIGELVRTETKRINEQVRQVRSDTATIGPDPVSEAELAALERYRVAIADWIADVDGVGLIVVNA